MRKGCRILWQIILSGLQAKGCYHEVIGKIESYKYTSDVTDFLLQLFQHIK